MISTSRDIIYPCVMGRFTISFEAEKRVYLSVCSLFIKKLKRGDCRQESLQIHAVGLSAQENYSFSI